MSVRILVLIGTLFVARAAFAEADGPDYFDVTGVADDVLNVHADPRATSRKVGTIPADARRLRNLGCEGGLTFSEWRRASRAEREASQQNRWCRVSYRDVEGWVAARFLSESNANVEHHGAVEWRARGGPE